jgi:hypothetical protein
MSRLAALIEPVTPAKNEAATPMSIGSTATVVPVPCAP